MAVTTIDAEARGMLSVTLAGLAATTGGAIAAIKNPEGVDLVILRSFLYITTPSTGSATLSVGVAAAATTSATDMLNALTANGSLTGYTYLGSTGGDASKDSITAIPALWQDDYYVTVTGSATTAGFAGILFIEYLRVG